MSASGLLGGVATTDGFYTFAIKATDSGNPAQTRSAQDTVQIADPPVITSSATFPNACANKPYTFQVKTSGGPVYFGFSSSAWIPIDPGPGTTLSACASLD